MANTQTSAQATQPAAKHYQQYGRPLEWAAQTNMAGNIFLAGYRVSGEDAVPFPRIMK